MRSSFGWNYRPRHLTDEDNTAGNALYRSAGGTAEPDVICHFSYEDD